MPDPVTWLILLPLLWATAAFILGPGRGANLAIVGVTLQLGLAAALAYQLMTNGIQMQAVGGWQAPLGIELLADGLATTMLLLTQLVALPLVLYARTYFAGHPQGRDYFWPLTGFLLAAMHAMFLSADLFNLYVTLELLSLSAVGLVASGGSTSANTAALRYLFASLLGSGAYLLGIALLYGAYGSVSIAVLIPLITEQAPAAVFIAAGLMLSGLMLKTALFPFHFWLPPAHGGAPAPVSALLSSLVIKASFYLILRLWLTVFLPLSSQTSAQLMGALGAIAVVWGSVMALKQARLKMLIAYSTVAQIGYLFLVFPLITHAPSETMQSAMHGVILQISAHALAKAAMFAAAGVVIASIGHDSIDHLGGISSRLPMTLFTLGLAGVTLMGLPPSAGFLAKWLLIDSAIASRQWWWVASMILGGLLTATYVFKILRHAFLHAEQSKVFHQQPRMLEWPAFLLALASIVLSLLAGDLLFLADIS